MGDVHEPTPLASATPGDTVDDGGSAPTPPVDASDCAPSAIATNSASAAASVAPVASSRRAPVTCACFTWIHRDENGQQCFPTFGACQQEFRGFGRKDKLPCRIQRDDGCGSFACRRSGAECYGR